MRASHPSRSECPGVPPSPATVPPGGARVFSPCLFCTDKCPEKQATNLECAFNVGTMSRVRLNTRGVRGMETRDDKALELVDRGRIIVAPGGFRVYSLTS